MYLIKVILRQRGINLNSSSCKLPVIEIIFGSEIILDKVYILFL